MKRKSQEVQKALEMDLEILRNMAAKVNRSYFIRIMSALGKLGK